MKYSRYQIIEEIGKGSMGVVYKAHDPQIDRLIAIKILRKDRVTNQELVRRFLKEAQAIYDALHDVNLELAERLKEKMKTYLKFIRD